MAYLLLEGVGGGEENAWISSAPARWFDGKTAVFPPVMTSKELKKYAEDPTRKPNEKWKCYRAKIRRSFATYDECVNHENAAVDYSDAVPSEPEVTLKRKKIQKQIFDPSVERRSPCKTKKKRKKTVIDDSDGFSGDEDDSPSEMEEDEDDTLEKEEEENDALEKEEDKGDALEMQEDDDADTNSLSLSNRKGFSSSVPSPSMFEGLGASDESQQYVSESDAEEQMTEAQDIRVQRKSQTKALTKQKQPQGKTVEEENEIQDPRPKKQNVSGTVLADLSNKISSRRAGSNDSVGNGREQRNPSRRLPPSQPATSRMDRDVTSEARGSSKNDRSGSTQQRIASKHVPLSHVTNGGGQSDRSVTRQECELPPRLPPSQLTSRRTGSDSTYGADGGGQREGNSSRHKPGLSQLPLTPLVNRRTDRPVTYPEEAMDGDDSRAPGQHRVTSRPTLQAKKKDPPKEVEIPLRTLQQRKSTLHKVDRKSSSSSISTNQPPESREQFVTRKLVEIGQSNKENHGLNQSLVDDMKSLKEAVDKLAKKKKEESEEEDEYDLPIVSKDDLKDLNDLISTDRKEKKKLKQRLRLIGGTSPDGIVRKILYALLDVNLAKTMTWYGLRGNENFGKSPLGRLIVDLCTGLEKHPMTEVEVAEAGKNWFIHRKDKKKKKDAPAALEVTPTLE